MYPGLTENEAINILNDTLSAAGLEPFFDIVLFGASLFFSSPNLLLIYTKDEDASNPHGGTDGSKVLEAETFVLIEVGIVPLPTLPLSLTIPVPIYMATPPTSAGLSSRLSSLNPLPSLVFHQPSRKT